MFEPIHNFFILDNKLHTKRSNMCVLSPPKNHIYEVFRVIRGVPLFIEDHLKRLAFSAKSLQMSVDADIVLKDIETLIRVNSKPDGNIKIIIWKDVLGQHILIFYISHQYPSSEEMANGVIVGVLRKERSNPNVKLFDNEMRGEASKRIADNSVYEVLLVNEAGYITEGSRSNVFFVKNNKVFTPPTEDVLQGVTRQKIIEIIEKQNIKFVMENIAFNDISNFESVFISGTSRRVLPVKSILDTNINYNVNNDLLRLIEKEFLNVTNLYIENYINQK